MSSSISQEAQTLIHYTCEGMNIHCTVEAAYIYIESALLVCIV